MCVAVCVLASGCGGGGTSSASVTASQTPTHPTTTDVAKHSAHPSSGAKAAYIVKADRICAAARQQLTRVQQPKPPQTQTIQAAAAYLTALRASLHKALAISATEHAAIRALPEPAADRPALSKIWELSNLLRHKIEQLYAIFGSLSAIVKSSTTSHQSLLGRFNKLQLKVSGLEASVLQEGNKSRTLAERFGFKQCVKPAAVGGSAPTVPANADGI
jgi:DNA repair ATPase RecN